MNGWIARAMNAGLRTATGAFTVFTATLAMAPEFIPQYWADIEALIPTKYPKESVHHVLLLTCGIITIILRGRRQARQ